MKKAKKVIKATRVRKAKRATKVTKAQRVQKAKKATKVQRVQQVKPVNLLMKFGLNLVTPARKRISLLG